MSGLVDQFEEPMPPHSLSPLSPESARLMRAMEGTGSSPQSIAPVPVMHNPKRYEENLVGAFLANVARVVLFIFTLCVGAVVGIVIYKAIIGDMDSLWPFGEDDNGGWRGDERETGDEPINTVAPDGLSAYIGTRKELCVWRPSIEQKIFGEHTWHLLLANRDNAKGGLASMYV
ncbi:hypothetical protein KIPB_013161 [Kipferlia bialata]|uniref:Uncharacterized protein n=1 Tax=Kipferlia bialata TaxID=797122 RepID=A0A9K3D7E9_9EUKA|nr:hypothetical protein KIPB_013161 [Kipferlia bialata]|eukprot:g13161.t1